MEKSVTIVNKRHTLHLMIEISLNKSTYQSNKNKHYDEVVNIFKENIL